MTLAARVHAQFQIHDALRVLFLFDPDGAYAGDVEAWDGDGVRCVRVEDPGFSLTYRLEMEWADERVLLYLPHTRPRSVEEYPLGDLLVANRVLHIDRLAEFMEAFGLEDRHRRVAEAYFKGELEYKNRQEVLRPVLRPERFTERNVQQGLAAYHLDATPFRTVPSEDELLAAVFVEALDGDRFDAYRQKSEERQFADFLGHLLARRFELDRLRFDVEQVREAAERLKYNLLRRTLGDVAAEDPYVHRLAIDTPTLLQQLYGLAAVWESSATLARPYPEVLDRLAPGVDETRLVAAYGADASFGYLSPTLRRARIEQGAAGVRAHPSRVRDQIVGPLRSSHDEATSALADLLWHMASFYATRSAYSTLDWTQPERFVEAYTEALYVCDTHYRHAALSFRRIRTRHPHDRELVEEAYEHFLHDYDDLFVTPLNVAWQRCLQEAIRRGESLPGDGLARFFPIYVNDAPKTAVIISDGLRYEVARELQDRLQTDRRRETEIGSLLAPLPSVTALGKASLLPHETIGWDGTGFTIDGLRTGSTKQREAVLQRVVEESRAMTYEEISALGIRAGRDLFMANPLIYVYHDRIDATGDKAATEADTPGAVEETVEELFHLVRTITNFNVYRVVITADHGFLYSERELPESQQEPFPEAEEPVLLRKNRCVVAAGVPGAEGYRFPIRRVSTVEEDWTVAVPRAVNRYQLQGSGKRYAHGGASLQEMVVPVLEVRKAREDRAVKVGVRLVARSNTITSGSLKVQLLQVDSISNDVQARTLRVGLYDDHDELVSDENDVVLQSTSSNPTDRTYSVVLTLRPEANDLNAVRCRGYDADDPTKLNPVVEQRFTIQRLFDQDDF